VRRVIDGERAVTTVSQLQDNWCCPRCVRASRGSGVPHQGCSLLSNLLPEGCIKSVKARFEPVALNN